MLSGSFLQRGLGFLILSFPSKGQLMLLVLVTDSFLRQDVEGVANRRSWSGRCRFKADQSLKLGHCQSGARARLLWSDADWISDCFVLYNILRLRTSFMILYTLIHYCIYYEVYFQSYSVHLHICTSAHSRRAPRRWINTIAGHMASGGFGRWFWTTGHSKRCKQPGFGMVFGFILLERLRHFFKVESPSFRWTEGFKGGLFTVLRYDLAPGEKRCCEFQDEGLRQRWGLDGPRLCHEVFISETFSDIFLSEDIWSCASFRSKVGPPNGIVCHWKRSRMMRHVGREEVVRIAVLSTTCSHIAEDIVRGDLALESDQTWFAINLGLYPSCYMNMWRTRQDVPRRHFQDLVPVCPVGGPTKAIQTYDLAKV